MKQSLLIRHLRPLLMTALAVVAGAVPCTSLADTANDTGLTTTTGNETDVKKATAIFSADGSTLVITASGDLTNYSSSVKTLTKRKFSSAAATKITTAENTYSFVKTGDEYQTWRTYYEATVTYKEVASSDIKTYLGDPWGDDGKHYTVQRNQPQTYKSVDNGTESSMTITVDGKDVTVIPLSPGDVITFDTKDKDNLYVVENATYSKIDKDAFLANPEYTKYFDNEYTSSEKTFSEQVKSKLDDGSYSSVRFVKAEGGADITISLDQMEAIIAYSNYNSKSQLKGNNSLIDFSAVGTISDLGVKEVPNTVNNVSVVLPDALSDADAKSIASEQKNGNWYWLSDDGTCMNIEGLYPGRFSSAASVKLSGETKSIVVMGKVGFDILEQKNLQNLDIAGIDNLDIHYVTTTDGNQFSMKEPFTVFNGFKNLKRVVLPGTDDISTLKEPDGYESSVEVFQSLPFVVDSYTDKTTTGHALQTLVLKPGVVKMISHYTPKDFIEAVCFDFMGNAGYDDLAWFSGVRNKRVNLTKVAIDKTMIPKDKTMFDAFETIKNDEIEYLALPNAARDTMATLFPAMKANIPNLKGLSYFNDTTFTAQTWLTSGGISILTSMMSSLLYSGDNKSNIKAIRISGPVNAEDLSSGTTVDANGHLTFEQTMDVVQKDDVDPVYQRSIKTPSDKAKGYARNHGALRYTALTTADLSGAEIDKNYPNDLCLSLLGCYADCDSIALPRTGKEIPCDCFANFRKLKSLCIPESYEYIRGGAFQNVNSLMNISTTIGKSIVSHGDSTIVISKNMKLIETGAFSNVEHIIDVYCLGDEAPEAQRWAFNTTMTYGNSGFSPSPAITRKNYTNGGKPISVLHFPTTCTAEQIKKYTDPTREYSITDGQGTTDGHGHYLVWPNQSEFIRAYVQGHTGYTWNGWNPARAAYNNALVYALNEGMQAHQTQADSLWNKSGSPADTKFYDSSDKTTAQKDYRGWHEFALVAAYNYEEPDPIYNFGSINDNNWWTLCLPFDMTKKNLRLVFGNPDGGSDITKGEDYPRVCELIGVERNVDMKSIVLQFGKDLVMNTSETDNTMPSEDAFIMKAGHPYLIKPKMPDADNNPDIHWTPSKHVLKYSQISLELKDLLAHYGSEGVGGVLRDSIKSVKAVAAKQAGDSKENDTYYYRFIGTFGNWYIPQYSYFLGWYGNGPAWWWKPSTTATERHWAPNTCIILVKKNSEAAPEFVTSKGQQEVAHWNVTSSGFEFCDDDTFADQKASGSKRAGMLFDFVGDPGTTTGISHVVIDTSKADPSSAAPVYNLNGQMVSRSGDTSCLSRGVYIHNGKKFVIK